MTYKYGSSVAANGKSFAHLEQHMRVGSPRGICTNCGEGFTSDSAYDRHQRFDVKKDKVICRHPATVNLVLDETGFWRCKSPAEVSTSRV